MDLELITGAAKLTASPLDCDSEIKLGLECPSVDQDLMIYLTIDQTVQLASFLLNQLSTLQLKQVKE